MSRNETPWGRVVLALRAVCEARPELRFDAMVAAARKASRAVAHGRYYRHDPGVEAVALVVGVIRRLTGAWHASLEPVGHPGLTDFRWELVLYSEGDDIGSVLQKEDGHVIHAPTVPELLALVLEYLAGVSA
jgi:hypothetical protein